MKDFDWFSWALLTAVVWGVVPIFEKMGLVKAQPYAGVVLRCAGIVIGVIFMIALRPSCLTEIKGLSWTTITFLLLAGILGSVVGQITNFSAMKLGEVSRVTPVTGSWPMVAFIIGLVFFSEAITLYKIIAAVFILAGIVLLRL
ncbi:MAG: EamA family transporter [Planctomycetes bacterium]|nr:EamA family transporter [Planctomycetota bacterium]